MSNKNKNIKGIYCYIDLLNNEVVYIGKDSHIEENRRHKQHLMPSKYNEQPFNCVLQNNPDRYMYFEVYTIPNCNEDLLNILEKDYIKRYNPKFNFTKGGEGTLGYKHSDETKKKISESEKGKRVSEKSKLKMSISHKGKVGYWKGKTFSEEHRANLSKNHADFTGKNHPLWGKHHSEETKQKLSKINTGKTISKGIRLRISKTINSTGYYRVTKHKDNSCKQGFLWEYNYYDNGKRNSLTSVDINKLESKVKSKGLEWYKL